MAPDVDGPGWAPVESGCAPDGDTPGDSPFCWLSMAVPPRGGPSLGGPGATL
ncbi:hypothetical protein GKC29_02265 [Micromonospora sp. WMMC415]|nr:hypothetical protein GKC29_02265 [Micromonospora sp. WMMC415]